MKVISIFSESPLPVRGVSQPTAKKLKATAFIRTQSTCILGFFWNGNCLPQFKNCFIKLRVFNKFTCSLRVELGLAAEVILFHKALDEHHFFGNIFKLNVVRNGLLIRLSESNPKKRSFSDCFLS